MRLLRLLFNFYINASIHVALAVTSLLYVTFQEFDISFSSSLFGIVFFGTISGYNFIKYARIAGLHHRSLATSLKGIQVFSFLCAGILLYFLFKLQPTLWVPLFILGLFTALYAIPFLAGKSLRTLHGIKIFVVALVWAGVTVLFPLWNSVLFQEANLWLSFSQVFLLVIVWTLPFEIRDIDYDAQSLGTLPQKLGVKKTKILGTVLMLGVLVMEGIKEPILEMHFWSVLFVAVLSVLLLWISQKKQPKYFASFWVESIPIVWMLLTVVLKGLF